MPLGSSGPYTEQNIINEVFSSGSAALRVIQAAGGTGTVVSGTGGNDTLSQTATGQVSQSVQYLFNEGGTVWERQRNNYQVTVIPSGTYISTATSTAQINYNAKGMALIIEVTTGSASGTIGTLQVQIPIGTAFMTIYTIVPGAITTGTSAVLVYPGAASAGNWSVAPVQGVIPRDWRLRVTHITTTSTMSYNITASYIL